MMEKNEFLSCDLNSKKTQQFHNLYLLRDRVSALVELSLLMDKTSAKKQYRQLLSRAKEIFSLLPPPGFENYTHSIENKGYQLPPQGLAFGISAEHLRFDPFLCGNFINLLEKGNYQEASKSALQTAKSVQMAIKEIEN